MNRFTGSRYNDSTNLSIIDFILNLAGLLLWLNWRSIQFDPLTKRLPATLMGTLRPATPKKLRRWHFLVFIAGLLVLRAVIYWWIGPAVRWNGQLYLCVIKLSFHTDWFLRVLAFSFASFCVALGILYQTLLFLSLLGGPEPIHRLVKIPLGWADDWPAIIKILLPFVIMTAAWWLASWLFVWLQIMPPPASEGHRIAESLVVGLGSYLLWKFPAVILLLLYLLNSYIYFGRHPFWNYVRETAQKILSPLKPLPLRAGKVDFTPVLAVVLIFLAAGLATHGLMWLTRKAF